jgi:hypothetical protein
VQKILNKLNKVYKINAYGNYCIQYIKIYSTVARRHLMAALYVSSLLILLFLINLSSDVYVKSVKIYYYFYCTTMCIICRDESLVSDDYNW